MNKLPVRISGLAITLSLFQLGSTTLFLLGGTAKQDAWISMSIGAVSGLLLLLLYLVIYNLDAKKDLFELFRKYFGKIMGSVIALAFVAYFTYEASRNLRDLGELTVMTLLDRTPLFFTLLVAIIVIANSVRYGPRVFFIICTTLMPVLVLAYGLLLLFISITGNVHLEFLLPVLENGIGPVLSAAIPELVSFPFGQTVLFLVFFPFVPKSRHMNKTILYAYCITALILIVLNQLVILILGPGIAANSTYPLLQVVQIIQLTKVLERTDALFTLVLFLGLGIKITCFYLGAVIGLYRITSVDIRIWVIPLGTVILLLSLMSKDYTEFIWIGLHFTVTKVFPLFQIALPILLISVMLLRKNKRKEG
ncbi:GerAB/ArcD/ProY family transporter [Paenibacillus sp. YPG26]|uniref:GerAB/ArcD/ProY family transporter n=1 Tax=Paenibacillus sp. YPG26 TaxID=2878915 RepID=UPI00203B7229|nr:GerAB/ArcD/ProY family transporter [Paenibacillus sp. YPG26]USB31736.1 spore germination protein [Paenibacillus sp. YPG26]